MKGSKLTTLAFLTLLWWAFGSGAHEDTGLQTLDKVTQVAPYAPATRAP